VNVSSHAGCGVHLDGRLRPRDILFVVHAGTCGNALWTCSLLFVMYVFGCISVLLGVQTRKRWHIHACVQILSGFLTM